jgi:hypothetical protein
LSLCLHFLISDAKCNFPQTLTLFGLLAAEILTFPAFIFVAFCACNALGVLLETGLYFDSGFDVGGVPIGFEAGMKGLGLLLKAAGFAGSWSLGGERTRFVIPRFDGGVFADGVEIA